MLQHLSLESVKNMEEISVSHKKMASIKYGTSLREDKPEDKKTCTCLDILEIAVLIVCIGVVWILLLLPIIFYHLPDEIFMKNVGNKAVLSFGIAR